MSNINYSSELRIGNIVSFPIEKSGENSYYENSVIVKLSLLYASAFVLNGDSNKYYETPIPKIIPTQLTQGWLLKFGFKTRTTENHSVQYFIGENPITKDWLFDILWQDSQDYPFYRNGHFKIKYVHQLQNLFFALTGEDLQLSDS